MSAEQSVATPIFDGVVAEAGLDWPEEDIPSGGKGEAEEATKSGTGK